jgi:FkbM family methyltransferase
MYGRPPMVSYSQNGEDVILDRVFWDVEKGFYVDAGAYDPEVTSVTRHFYLRGWRGINIEPSSRFERFPQGRPEDINLNLAVSTARGTRPFHEFPNAIGLSSFSGELHPDFAHLAAGRVVREVATLPLRDVFGEHRVSDITFLSVDVEGHEREVLMSNDWQRYRPRVVLIEATLPNTPTPSHDRWEDVLLAAGYQFAFFDGLNRYYVRDEDAPLRERFNAPANVFDNFRRVEFVVSEQELAEARAINQQLQEEIALGQQRIAQLDEDNDEKTRALAILLARLRGIEQGVGERSLKVGLWVARRLHKLMSLRRQNAPPQSKAA